jgi:threonine dehydratase
MITLDDVERARARIRDHVVPTPVDRSTTLAGELGPDVYLKLELFQRTGSFKPRGAINQILALDEEQRRRGVVGVSGGNFAQGLAYAGAVFDVPTLVVMPEGTPQNYVAATRGYGARIEFAPTIADAFAAVDAHVAAGMAAVHPFDHPAMMAGNGTVGLEVVEQVPDVTDVVVSVGGGGLMTGVTVAIKGRRPDVRVWAVETVGADALARSLAAGEQVRITPTSIARTLGSPYAAADAIAVAREHLEDVVVVPDAEAVAASRFLLERAKVLAEPAAACTLAAARRVRERLEPAGTLVLILCGGNLSVADLCHLTERFGA